MSNSADGLAVPVPEYQSLMLPILRALTDGHEQGLTHLRTTVAEQLKLSPEDLDQRLASGSQPVFVNRFSWALQYLKGAGAIESPRRATYRIASRGTALVKENPPEITIATLSAFPEFAHFRAGNPEPHANGSVEPVSAKDTPEETLARSYQIQNDALVAELLDSVMSGSPAAFEKLVVDVLVAMGYGGSAQEASVVGRSGDGGIDGIIKQDPLGLETVYVQAKRWTGSVGSPEIMKFSGGLTKRHATRGIFITSSCFSRDAREYVESLPQKIVLIDGKRLAELMIAYDVGVAPERTYTLKRVDPAYFEAL